MDATLLRIWLASKRFVSAKKAIQLLEYFGTIENLYNAEKEDYKKYEKLTLSAISDLSDKNLDVARKIIDDCEKLNIEIIPYGSKLFPEKLKLLDDPMQVLYVKGKIPDWEKEVAVSIVGTRKNTDYGEIMARKISSDLAKEGVTIISGMAVGIDSIVQREAIKKGTSVMAVLGCGLDRAYPTENRSLMMDIINQGCVISEYPPYSPIKRHHFPQRNRIVAALSDAVVCVEAPKRSGTLITARYAMEMSKPLFSVPASSLEANSRGTNDLLKYGASAITSGEDILKLFSKRIKNLTKPIPQEMDDISIILPQIKQTGEKENLDEKIIQALKGKTMSIENLSQQLKEDVQTISKRIVMLELLGKVEKVGSINYTSSTI